MATLIKADGTKTQITPADPAKGFTLEELYKHIGCTMVEGIETADGGRMLFDEEAKLVPGRLDVNVIGTKMLAEAGGIPGDFLLGTILLLDAAEAQGEE